LFQTPVDKAAAHVSGVASAERRIRPDSYFFEQSRVIPVDGVGHDAVQMPPRWMLGCSVAPSFDRHVTEAMISPTPHSEVHPTEPQVSLPIDLA